MIDSTPYYWLVCDMPGCKRKSTEGGDYSAWESGSSAMMEAEESEWWISDDGQTHICDIHAQLFDPERREEMEPYLRYAYNEWYARRGVL